jgi:hypothetical protein
MPAFFAGALVSPLLDLLRPGLPEWVSCLPVLLIVPFLWYCVGVWADNTGRSRDNSGEKKDTKAAWWVSFVSFTLMCAAAASISSYVGSNSSYLFFGIAIWSAVAIGFVASSELRRRRAKVL